jgi:hypothetical protein
VECIKEGEHVRGCDSPSRFEKLGFKPIKPRAGIGVHLPEGPVNLIVIEAVVQVVKV